jgi:hypothetical protein
MQSGNTQAVPLTGSDQVVAAFGCIYMGFSIRETAGSTAVIRIWDSPNSTTTDDSLLDPISLAANESAREYYPEGINAGKGIWVDIVSGTVEGSVRVIKSERRALLDT